MHRALLAALLLSTLSCHIDEDEAPAAASPSPPPGGGGFVPATGIPDTTFDTDGIATTDFGGATDEAHAVAIQTDGRIVVVGTSNAGGTLDFAMARYNTDGTLDTAFDTDGMVTTDFAGGADQAWAVAIQTDGAIVVAGESGGNFAVARYTSAGALDTTFDTDGLATVDFDTGADVARAALVQGDGRILLAGTATISGTSRIAAARFTAAGALDTTFDFDGRRDVQIGDSSDGFAAALQTDERILIAGQIDTTGALDIAVARLNPDGSLDLGFDTDGMMVVDIAGGDDVGTAIATSGGATFVAGTAFTGANDDAVLIKVQDNGSLDPTFDFDGRVGTDFATDDDDGRAVLIQPNGMPLVAATATVAGSRDFAFTRFSTGGSPDPTFAGDGTLTQSIGAGDDLLFGAAFQTDGAIVAVGTTTGNSEFAVLRLR